MWSCNLCGLESRRGPGDENRIIPRGISALGYTVQMPLEDRYLMSKAELLNRITVLYGGAQPERLCSAM